MSNEALSRWEDLHNYRVTQNAQAFVMSSPTRCLRANMEHTAQTDLSMVPVVDMGRLLARYKHSSKRLLLLDFQGAGSVAFPEPASLRHSNPSSKPPPCSNALLTTHATRCGC